MVFYFGKSPRVTERVMIPSRITSFCVKVYRGELGLRQVRFMPILSKQLL